MKRFLFKLPVFLLIMLVCQLVVSLEWTWGNENKHSQGWHLDLLHKAGVTIPDADYCEITPEIKAIQINQQTHPDLGFIWKRNIDTTENVVVKWGDIDASALSTDRYGFVNTTDAITQLTSCAPVDIIGIGASFMGGAQGLFYEYFWIKNLFYYNMANARFTLPQFNVALREYALPLKPKLILYGLNEASFYMIDDYEKWKRSGMDWFTYHSGSWCGPAVKTGFPYDQMRRISRQLLGLYAALNRSLFRTTLDLTPARRKRLMDKTFAYIKEAHNCAKAQRTDFIVLCIPDKGRMIGGPSPRYFIFEEILPRLDKAGIKYIDLRKDFILVDDPRTLYFNIDNHWNRRGIYIAAKAVLRAINKG